MSTTLPLTTPIIAHGIEVSELTFRDLTTDDIIEIGLPMLMVLQGDTGGMDIRQGIIAKYVIKLASIPRSSVSKLSPKDFGSCQEVVMGFFGMGGSTDDSKSESSI